MNIQTPLFDNTGKATEPLEDLLRLFEVPHVGTIASVRDATQLLWYQAGRIRAEIEERHGDKRADAMLIFKRLDMVDAITAPLRQYSRAVLLGAIVPAIRRRLKFLVSEWERGVRFQRLECVGSDRGLLQGGKEAKTFLLDDSDLQFDSLQQAESLMPSYEGESFEWLCRNCSRQLPWNCERRDTIFCGGRERVTMEDTLRKYVNETAPTGSHLFISSQPFVLDQRISILQAMPEGAAIDVIGYPAPQTMGVSTYLDSIAKTVFKLAS